MKRQRSLLEYFSKRREEALDVASASPAADPWAHGATKGVKDGLPLALETSAAASSSLAATTSKMPLRHCASDVAFHSAAPQIDDKENIGDGAPSRPPTFLRCAEKTRRMRNGARSPQAAVQTSLDFGQNNAGGVLKCGLCGMLFNFTVKEDIRIHERCCNALSSGSVSATMIGRQFADGLDMWIASEQLGKALEGVAQPKRRSQAVRDSTRKCTPEEFCTRVQETSDSELVLYVFDCSKKDCVEDAVFRRLVESLQFSDVLSCASAYCLVSVVYRHAGCLLCAVAGRPFTRQQDPVLLLRDSGDSTVTHCYTRSCMTFCDVPYVWCQSVAVLESTARDWWLTKTVAAMQSTRLAIQDFFYPTKRNDNTQQRLHALLESALRCAVTTLGRHVSYGHTLCPRSEFSYDCSALSVDVLSRVDSVTACIDSERPLYTHNNGCDALVDSESSLSVVSYGD
ncbi:hypothetical protein BCY84_00477 [Trypanosoma cruzi cruzi]|uniref:N-acetyltransferase ESCO zinc-finger domain-containing protein n=1 Tax=Trypanosoma cruzi TaxID=5693 RepID=A0A2V2UL03_TRYCR|nr:putative zinc-finger of acetyl-transferase ESCO [Trypanosoma cruzi]PBJ81199.1 hypothetical protein BCY84_00477 [Trypanosoma cruzi cruzi]PWU84724.1 hypothetical protein C4B63_206g12 [Trypanosoma cruzi]